ncbi:MAG: DNA-directed RNA polymerase [archaeon]|nr:DNA-directed RNA polymerase [archaeon]
MVRIPPSDLSKSIEDVIDERAWESFEGKFGPDKKFIIAIRNVKPKGDGRIVHGDGAVYQTVEFDQLVCTFKEGEIIDGIVVQIAKYGAFISIGPLDGLLHVSQIGDDVFDVDVVNKRIVGKEKGRTLTVGDKVRVRVISISINEKVPKDSKIGLTTKQPGLGKPEWIAEDSKKKDSA